MATRKRIIPPRDSDHTSELGRFFRQICDYINNERHGEYPSTDYTSFQDDGFLFAYGEAQAWNDMQFQISSGKVSAVNAPTWEAFTANTSEYSFAVDDYIDMGSNEPPHGWLEGSDGSCHMHVATKAANATGSNRYAKFTVYIAWSNVGGVWTELTPLTAELTIPTGTAALTHFLIPMGTVSIPTGEIGLQMKIRVKRIAATTGTEYSGNIFINQVGDHILFNSLGSREIAAK